MNLQGQQSGPKVADLDLMTQLNLTIKQTATQLTTAILESSSPQVRQQVQTALQTCLQHQQQLSQLMMQKGYYQPLPASPEMLQAARDQIETVNAQVGAPFLPGLTQQIQPATMAPATGAGPMPPIGQNNQSIL